MSYLFMINEDDPELYIKQLLRTMSSGRNGWGTGTHTRETPPNYFLLESKQMNV